MRTVYLVCYDVADPRRLRRVHRFLLGYKAGGQKSFFECWLTPAELRHVQDELTRLLDAVTDRAHLFQLDPRQAGWSSSSTARRWCLPRTASGWVRCR